MIGVSGIGLGVRPGVGPVEKLDALPCRVAPEEVENVQPAGGLVVLHPHARVGMRRIEREADGVDRVVGVVAETPARPRRNGLLCYFPKLRHISL